MQRWRSTLNNKNMKNIPHYLLTLAIALQCSLFPLHSTAQDKQDVVIMLNGEKKSGKVVAVNEQTIRFAYTGETLEYEIKKEQINKIEFASGRVEVINAAPQAQSAPTTATPGSSSAATAEQRKNKIAILPFEILSNDPSLITDAMSKQVQLSCVNEVRGVRPQQIIQDPNVTNALMAKGNFSVANLSAKTPQEWAEFLGVEYVIMGAYSIQNKGSVSSTSGYSSSDTKKKDDGQKKSTTTYGSGTSYTTTSFDTKVTLNIYHDDGSSLYSNTRAPAFGRLDSYQPALKYMLKRSPLAK